MLSHRFHDAAHCQCVSTGGDEHGVHHQLGAAAAASCCRFQPIHHRFDNLQQEINCYTAQRLLVAMPHHATTSKESSSLCTSASWSIREVLHVVKVPPRWAACRS